MENKFKILINKLNHIKPEYGSITIDLTFHQNELSKIKIIDRSELIVFEKEKKNG